jgi:MFS family permease
MILKNTVEFFKVKEIGALSFLFSSNSLMIAIWATSLPFIKERLGLSDGNLGLILLFAPLGSLTGVFISTRIFSKIIVGKWLGVGNVVYCILMCIEVLSPSISVFAVALYFRGLTGFLNGVAQNIVVGNIEKKYNKRFISTCHGMYSIGGAVGAGFAAVLFAMGLKSNIQIILMFVLISAIVFLLRKHFKIHDYLINSNSNFQLPNRSILGLSFICLVMFMTEGSIVDWSSIYLQRELLAPLYLISLGYGGFSVAMTIGRLNGDIVIPRIGEKRLVITGILVASFGFLIIALVPMPIFAIIGFIITGLGCATIVPVLFSAATKIKNTDPVQGFGMITSGGLFGFLLGPSLIGFISNAWTLSLGFLFIFVMLLFACYVAFKNKFLGNLSNILS